MSIRCPRAAQLDRRPYSAVKRSSVEHFIDWPAQDLVSPHHRTGGGEVDREREQMRDDQDCHAPGAIQIAEKRGWTLRLAMSIPAVGSSRTSTSGSARAPWPGARAAAGHLKGFGTAADRERPTHLSERAQGDGAIRCVRAPQHAGSRRASHQHDFERGDREHRIDRSRCGT